MLVFLEVEPEDIAKIQKIFPKAQIISKPLNENEIIKKCHNAEILCVFIYSQITKKVIKNLPNLKLIVTRSVGYDHIDLNAAKEKGIKICNVPDYGSHVIAEHVFALLLCGLRHISEGDDRVEKNHKFDFHGLRGMALKAKTLGLIGTGKIGKNVARIASLGFLMNVIAYDPYPDEDAARENHFQYVSLDKLLQKSDIISLHCPLLPNTKHIINKKSIEKMKNGIVIVNTSRGEIIETKALLTGLKSKKISHVFLDVLEHEKNLAENKEIINFPEVIVTPHIAFYADDSMKKMYEEAFSSIKKFLKGEKLMHQVEGI
ncbi:hypothetical protein A2335_05015 [Candidatus Peregrinibacteria bacterium RIFOXYB2_FULL_32_7]|nr:MAG: hypothetical protein A2335_05015 [Candidatus Peregrinibacteria bacterium RIFOXYB2_FULL_32_7]